MLFISHIFFFSVNHVTIACIQTFVIPDEEKLILVFRNVDVFHDFI